MSYFPALVGPFFFKVAAVSGINNYVTLPNADAISIVLATKQFNILSNPFTGIGTSLGPWVGAIANNLSGVCSSLSPVGVQFMCNIAVHVQNYAVGTQVGPAVGRKAYSKQASYITDDNLISYNGVTGSFAEGNLQFGVTPSGINVPIGTPVSFVLWLDVFNATAAPVTGAVAVSNVFANSLVVGGL